MTDPFVHLHVASGYSLQYGASHPHVLVERAAEQEMDTLALTDRDGTQWLFYGSYNGGMFVAPQAELRSTLQQARPEAGVLPVGPQQGIEVGKVAESMLPFAFVKQVRRTVQHQVRRAAEGETPLLALVIGLLLAAVAREVVLAHQVLVRVRGGDLRGGVLPDALRVAARELELRAVVLRGERLDVLLERVEREIVKARCLARRTGHRRSAPEHVRQLRVLGGHLGRARTAGAPSRAPPGRAGLELVWTP